MARQPINHGTVAGDGAGETLFSAFQKVNANETELYAAKTEVVANAAALPVSGEETRLYLAAGQLYRWNAASGAYVAVGLVETSPGSGIYTANIVPRTGSLADLLAIDGGVGEVSVAVESGQVVGMVLHNGVANQAKSFVRSSLIGEVHAWSNATSLTGGSATTLLDFSAKTVETGRGNLDLSTNMATIPAGCSYIQCQGYVYFSADADITAGTKLKVVAEYELLTGVWIALGTVIQTAVAAAANENNVVYDFFSIADLSASWAAGTMRFRLRVEHNDATDVYSGIQGSMALRFYGKN